MNTDEPNMPAADMLAADTPHPEMNRANEHGYMKVEVDETPAAPVAEEAPVVVPEPVAQAPVEEPKPQPVAKPAAPARHVVTDADRDPVFLSACVYMNKFNRKSLTVHHLQRRLVELGYNDAVGDKDGWYGELTASAVSEFQKANRLEATGRMDAKTFEAVFAGDTNVEVQLNN